MVATLRFFQATLNFSMRTKKKLDVTKGWRARCQYRRRIPTDQASAFTSSSSADSSIYSSLALQLVNMRKDDEANDNNEPIICLSVCFFLSLSLFLFPCAHALSFSLSSLSLSLPLTHIVHTRESGRRKRKVRFFLLTIVFVSDERFIADVLPVADHHYHQSLVATGEPLRVRTHTISLSLSLAAGLCLLSFFSFACLIKHPVSDRISLVSFCVV